MRRTKKQPTIAEKIRAVLTSEPQRVPVVAERAGVSMTDVFTAVIDEPDRYRVVDLQTKPGRGQLSAIALA
jgi:hypothetical protein